MAGWAERSVYFISLITNIYNTKKNKSLNINTKHPPPNEPPLEGAQKIYPGVEYMMPLCRPVGPPGCIVLGPPSGERYAGKEAKPNVLSVLNQGFCGAEGFFLFGPIFLLRCGGGTVVWNGDVMISIHD